MAKILRPGVVAEEVVDIRFRLNELGIPVEMFSKTYTKQLADAISYFQQTHVGPYGLPLIVDGITGSDTRWALQHPHGKAQRSYIQPEIPNGIKGDRRRQLEIALAEHAKGVRERPNGSNRSKEIDKYLPGWYTNSQLRKGPPWCCFFWSWCDKQAHGKYSLGKRTGSCRKSMNLAMTFDDMWHSADEYVPIPGDAFVMLYGQGKGHIGFVLRVSKDGKRINTVEGNCGNRVKVGLRDVDDKIVGFINTFGDANNRPRFTKGIHEIGSVDSDSTQ